MRIDEMITTDDLRLVAEAFHARFGLYLALDDHLALTQPRRAAEGLRDLADVLELDDVRDGIVPADIDPSAISSSMARDLLQIEALSKSLR